jgi:hypothetical protein
MTAAIRACDTKRRINVSQTGHIATRAPPEIFK